MIKKTVKCNKSKKNNIIKLPPFKIEQVFTTLSQTIDWGIKKLNVPDTWKITQGENITVLVLDTGHPTHTDLTEAILDDKCKNFTNGSIEDGCSHSTMCCGIMGARNNNFGVCGVAPKINIITGKVMDDNGSGSYDSIINGLLYAIEIKPDIVSMSLGGPSDDPRMHTAIKTLTDMNIPVICAAGNEGGIKSKKNMVSYPGKYDEVITVAASDEWNNIADFSSWGTEVDISAPGTNILSTYVNNTYSRGSGTSFSCPFIAGIVALLLAKHRKQEQETGLNDCKTVEQIKEHLYKYSTRKSLLKDPSWGWGVIDPINLIEEKQITDLPTKISKPITNWEKFKNLLQKVFGNW